MRRDYIYAFLTEGFVLVSSLVAYKFAGYFFGQQGFSEYALARRTLSLVLPLALLGMDVAIPRYTAYAQAEQRHRNPNNYFLGGLMSIGLMATVIVLVLNIFQTSFAFLFFGDTTYTYLIPAISLMIIGGALHVIAYNTFRGLFKIGRANVLMFLNHGLAPLVVFFFYGKSVAIILSSVGILWVLISLSAFFFMPLTFTFHDLAVHVRELLRYGIRRMPNDFIQFTFFALPATITAHVAGIQAAGFVAFGISALGMVGSAFTPISLIILPEASQLIAKGDFAALRRHVATIIILSIVLVMMGTAIVEVGARTIVRLYLGDAFLPMAIPLQIIMIAALPYVLFVTMKSVIDAYHITMVNTINMVVSFLSFLLSTTVLFLLTQSAAASLWGFVVGLYVLAVLTMLRVRAICFAPRVAITPAT